MRWILWLKGSKRFSEDMEELLTYISWPFWIEMWLLLHKIIIITFNLVVKGDNCTCHSLTIRAVQNSSHYWEAHHSENWLQKKIGRKMERKEKVWSTELPTTKSNIHWEVVINISFTSKFKVLCSTVKSSRDGATSNVIRSPL